MELSSLDVHSVPLSVRLCSGTERSASRQHCAIGSAWCSVTPPAYLHVFPRPRLMNTKWLSPARELYSQYAEALQANGLTTWRQELLLSSRVGLEQARLT